MLNLACLVCLTVYSVWKYYRRFSRNKNVIKNNTQMCVNMNFILSVDQDISRVGKVNDLDIFFNTV